MEIDYNNLIMSPHILIAGTTGSGKSNLLHLIINTILNYAPCSLVLIDPKRVELALFRNYGNTQAYASDTSDIIKALKDTINLMDKRYKYMQDNGLFEYDGAHKYVIIDELADIMTTAKNEVLPLLQRLLQLGRAARIHVIAATQSPDRTFTLPARLKLNFTDRIALRCATAIESKQIIDRPGAETLPQYGYAIYRNCIGDCIEVSIPFLPTSEMKTTLQQARQRFKHLYYNQLLKNKRAYRKLYPEDFNIFGFRKLTSKNS